MASYWNLVYFKWIDRSGHLINSWADIINRADLGMEVMHERNAHNFPLDLVKFRSNLYFETKRSFVSK